MRCKHLYIIFLLILSGVSAIGQSTVSPTNIREEVRHMFDKPVKNVWILLLSGKLDGIHIIDMALGTDGKNCKGFYYLRSSGERFELDGDEDDGAFTLIESHKRGKSTGFIMAKFDGQNFSGKWMDVFKRQSLSFEANVVGKFDDFQPVLCDERSWHLYFKGKLGNLNAFVHVDKFKDNYYVFSKYGESVFLDTIPVSSATDALVFSIADKYKCILTMDALDYIVVENQEMNQNYLLPREAKAGYKCFEFINFTTRIETQRPVLQHKKFSLWLDGEFKKWYDQNDKKINQKNEESVSNQHRYRDVGYGWVEISFINDGLVSGNIFTQSSWKKGTDKKSFIYDLKQSRLIHPEELFLSSAQNVSVVESMIQEKKKLMSFKDPKVRDWVLKQNFNYIMLKEEGVSFQTGFSNIYGEHNILIPYEELQPYFKNKSMLKKF